MRRVLRDNKDTKCAETSGPPWYKKIIGPAHHPIAIHIAKGTPCTSEGDKAAATKKSQKADIGHTMFQYTMNGGDSQKAERW